MKKTLQYFSKDSTSTKMTPEQICEFLENYSQMVAGVDQKTQPISIRIPRNVLTLFKQKSSALGVSYQTQIVQLMRKWIEEK